jgi:hypothetical protein
MLPFIGRLPVSSQIFAIKSLSQKRSREHTSEKVERKPLSERIGCFQDAFSLEREIYSASSGKRSGNAE